jgi:hypothetical protein
VLVQIIDTNTNELIYGVVDNYQLNSVDVTLSQTLNDIKVVVAGGTLVELSGITTDRFTTGATLNGNTIEFNRNDLSNAYSVDLSSLISSGDTFVTGFTYDNSINTLTIEQNNGQPNLDVIIDEFNELNVSELNITNSIVGAPIINVTELFSDDITTSNLTATTIYSTNVFGGNFYGDGSNLTGLTDTFITGGTYNPNSGTATFNNNQGGNFDVIGFFTGSTDIFITGGTWDNGNILFSNNTGGTFTVLGSNQYGTGVISGATGWSQSFNGTITLPTVKAALYDNSNYIEPLRVYTVVGGISGTDFPALDNNQTNYIVIKYNGGNPVYDILSDDSTINDSDVVRFMTVYRLGNFIHTLEFGNQGAGKADRINDRLVSTERFKRESGFSLSLSGDTGVAVLTEGVAWNGINRQSLASVNSQDDIFFQNYKVSGNWVTSITADTINNQFYNDGTNPVSGTTGKFLVNYYFRGQEVNDHLYELWGEDEYDNLAEAQLSNLPSLPELISSHAFLVGRIIIPVGQFTGGTVESSFVTVFQAGAVTNHNDLSGIQGGQAGEYFHLTSNEYNNLALTNVDNEFSVSQTVNGTLSANTLTSQDLIVNSVTATTISDVDYIDFNTNFSGNPQHVIGRLNWRVDDGTLEIGMGNNGEVTQQVGLEQFFLIKNQTGSQLNKGTVIRASGTLGNSSRILADYMIADNTIPYYFTIGIATQNIADGDDGYVSSFGLVRGIDTTGSLYGETWVDGDILYVSPTTLGGLTKFEPTEPNLKIQMALVIKANANGSIFVRPDLGYKLGDLHDLQTSGATNGDLISFDSSDNIWKYTRNLVGNYGVNGNLNITGITNSDEIFVNTLTATTVNLPSLSSDTFNTKILTLDTNELIRSRDYSEPYNTGVISGATGWSQSFNGTITLPTVQVALYDNPNHIEPLRVYTVNGGISGTDFPALDNNQTSYIIIDYNGGNPVYDIVTDDTIINDSDVVRFMTVYRLDNFIHTLEFGNQGAGKADKLNNRIIATQRFARESGLSLGLSGSTGIVTVSEGVAWNGSNRQVLNSIASDGSTPGFDVFFKNYHVSGNWEAFAFGSSPLSPGFVNNQFYDDGTDIVSATTGNYLVNWYYRGQEINDHIYEVFGNDEYSTIAEAQLSTEPLLPELISSHAFLLGRIIIEVGENDGIVESAFIQAFQPTTVQRHNDLTDIQGGQAGEYFHLTSNEYNNLALTNVDNEFSTTQSIDGDLLVSGKITGNTLSMPNFVYIESKDDFPNSIGGVRTLEDNVTYFINTTVDLEGDRLVAGQNTTILGGSSENCRLKSTGLSGTALLSSEWSIPMRGITFEADVALNLDATGNANQAIDWFGVNFTDCNTIGLIKDYANVIWTDCAILGGADLTFDGTIGTVGFVTCLFSGLSNKSIFNIPSTATITRRFRPIYSSFIVIGSATGVTVSDSAIVNNDGFIMDTVNFAGGGTYISGINNSSPKALFVNNVGIKNTSNLGHLFMIGNAAATTIGAGNQGVWIKAEGSTSVGGNNSPKWLHTTNRLTYDGNVPTFFTVSATASLSHAQTNQTVSIGIAKNGTIISDSETGIRVTTANQPGFNGVSQTVVEMSKNDYIELFVKNNNGTQNPTVVDLNMIVNKVPA